MGVKEILIDRFHSIRTAGIGNTIFMYKQYHLVEAVLSILEVLHLPDCLLWPMLVGLQSGAHLA